jgi:hypothetical protein
MRIKIRRLISFILQVFGVVFLVLLTWKGIRTFLGSFDKELQNNMWTLVSLPDSSGHKYIVDSGIINLNYTGRNDVIVRNASCGEHEFRYRVSKYKHTSVYEYHQLSSCPFRSKECDVFDDFLGPFSSAACYKIKDDTLTILSHSGDTLVFRKTIGGQK